MHIFDGNKGFCFGKKVDFKSQKSGVQGISSGRFIGLLPLGLSHLIRLCPNKEMMV
jgi:hypothetical protein